MILAQQVGTIEIVVVLVYLLAVGYLGWMGYRRTRTAADYMVAGRKTHPFVMAMSYGATFISTSAIVGFGGVAGLFGMSLLWLTFLNIFVGIFIAFVFLGGPTRRMGHCLDAHTFPELLGRRFNSLFIQIFAGLIVTIFIPLYAAAVLIGGCEFIATAFFADVENGYTIAVLVFSVIIAAYVVVGGLKGVMYTDALQGSIMFVGMVTLLVFMYSIVGGVTSSHRALGDLSDMVPPTLTAIGHAGWSAMPGAGWGDAKYDLWWIVVSTIVMGVGIGVLAQPQLVVRFMTVKSKRELNRAVLIGGIFILIMTGVAFTVGSLSNVYFTQKGPLFKGKVVKMISEEKKHAAIHLHAQNDAGVWTPVMKDDKGKQVPNVIPVLLDAAQPGVDEAAGIVQGRSIAVVAAKGNPDQIIPTFITSAMPKWFGLLFLLTLLAAAMSTLSSQFHTLGTSVGRDVFETIATGSHSKEHPWSVLVVRIGIILGIVVAAIFALEARGGYIIARATAIFFGLCASAFLPAFVGGLFWKRMTKAGAIASMLVGFVVTSFWLLLVKSAEAKAIGLVQWVTDGKESILAAYPNWPVVDPLVVALPLSILTAIIVSLLTKPPADAHIQRCFMRSREKA
jgi:SSS family solute:Na+ symporter